jgi:hypothetical protein
LMSRKDRLAKLLDTLDKTITTIKNGMALTHEELYEGFPKEKGEAWRNEAIGKYGMESVKKSEQYLSKLGKEGFAKLKEESMNVTLSLLQLVKEDPAGERVQEQIAKHYVIIRKFWGTHNETDKQAEAYAGLGELYVSDERYTLHSGKPDPEFAQFMSQAMKHFAKKLSE